VDALFARLDDEQASAADREAAARTILERVLGRPGDALPEATSEDAGSIDWAKLAEELERSQPVPTDPPDQQPGGIEGAV
jgi:hypothetical protein